MASRCSGRALAIMTRWIHCRGSVARVVFKARPGRALGGLRLSCCSSFPIPPDQGEVQSDVFCVSRKLSGMNCSS